MSELERLERRMEDRWTEFAFADASTTAPARLERLYDQYLDALDAYMREKRKEAAQAPQPGGRGQA